MLYNRRRQSPARQAVSEWYFWIGYAIQSIPVHSLCVHVWILAPNPCEQITCPRRELCVLNIQGLPVCRCPSVYHCQNVPRRKVCSEDEETFLSMCHLRVKACHDNRRIQVAKKGACDNEVEVRRAEKERRREERMRARQQKLDAKQQKKDIRKEEKRKERRKNKKARRNQWLTKFTWNQNNRTACHTSSFQFNATKHNTAPLLQDRYGRMFLAAWWIRCTSF